MLSHSSGDKSDASKLRDCVIKLTDLGAGEKNKWLGFSAKGSTSNESSDSNKSKYYMRKCPNPVRRNASRDRNRSKPVIYKESPPSKELNDSDYEPVPKKGKTFRQ